MALRRVLPSRISLELRQRAPALLALLALVLTPGSAGALQQPAYDLLLRGGTVVDGTGAPGFRADVALRGDRIVRIAPEGIGEGEAVRVLDVGGLVVAPGFIDPHTHSRGTILDLPEAEAYLRQGVTTLVDGNDGSSPFPLEDFFRRVEEVGTAPNFALFVGHGVIRERAMGGNLQRPPSPAELDSMKAMVARGMREGALGLSTGLAYVPGNFAETDEIIEVARVAAAHGGIYISHMRDEGAGVLESLRETIRIGEGAGIAVQVTHHKVGGHRQFGQSRDALRLMADARARGIDVTFDQYPYTASSTGLGFLIPRWAFADEGLRPRLDDPIQAARIRAEMLEFLDERFAGDPSGVQLVNCSFDASLAGRTLRDILDERGVAPTPENMAELVLELHLRGGCGSILHSFSEEDVEVLLRSELGMIGSDGTLVAMGLGNPHPRGYGTYPRVLGRYVRERGVIPMEEAIRKMSGFPAQRLGLADRGRIEVGLVADIVVFDADGITDRATFSDPHQYSVGVVHVLVGGVSVLEEGEVTGERPGRILRGPGWSER